MSKKGPFALPLALTIPLLLALALVGCSPVQPDSQVTPSASSAPSPSSTTSSTTSATAAPIEGTGCPPNDIAVPDDAETATIDDVDDDGEPDLEFYTEAGGFSYGIHTASGATITLPDDLAGPNQHHGWTSKRENATITVLDDSRTATLHAFIDCAFVTTTDTSGRPYTFGLNGFYETGTGVECTDSNGGALLAGVLAAQQADGTYSIEGTTINLMDAGRMASNGASFEIATGVTQDDPQVTLAMQSTCGSVPIVATSGR